MGVSNISTESVPSVLALCSVVGNVVWNYASLHLDIGKGSQKEISDRHQTLFTPATWAFGIWGVIYTSLIIYAVVQLLPTTTAEHRALFDNLLNPPLIAANVIISGWIVIYRYDKMWLSAVVDGTALAASLVAFVHVHQIVDDHHQLMSLAWTVPFALLAGWMCVAQLGSISQAMVASHRQFGLGWALVMVLAATAVSAVGSLVFRDSVFPLIVAWGVFAVSSHADTWKESPFPVATNAAVARASWWAGMASVGLALVALWLRCTDTNVYDCFV